MSLAEQGTAHGRRGKGERHLTLVGPGWNPQSVTQEFFDEGERQEALGWKNEKLNYADYDDEVTVPDLDFFGPEAASLPPRNRGKWTVTVATIAALVLSAVTFTMAWRMYADHRAAAVDATRVAPVAADTSEQPYDVVPIQPAPPAGPTATSERTAEAPRVAPAAPSTVLPPVAAASTASAAHSLTSPSPAVAPPRPGVPTPSPKNRTHDEPARPLRGFVWSPTEGRLVPSGLSASADDRVPVE